MGKKSVTFSFDDGNLQDVPFVELLNKYGMKCTFNLNSDKRPEVQKEDFLQRFYPSVIENLEKLHQQNVSNKEFAFVLMSIS